MVVNYNLLQFVRCICRNASISQLKPKSRGSLFANERKSISTQQPKYFDKLLHVSADLAMFDCRQVQDNCAVSGISISPSEFEEIRKIEWPLGDTVVPADKPLITVMSYNVLAQDLIEGNFHLYKFHDPHHLKWENRRKLLMDEFLKSEADILALQEVQESHINSFYSLLEDYGYKGYFKKRTAAYNTDGCALYIKKDVFQVVNLENVEFHQPGIQILSRPNVALIAKLRHKATGKCLIVANTHLLYNPKRWDVRLAQIQVLLAEIHRVASTCESPSLLLVGDLNSPPKSPAIRLIETGFYQADAPILPQTLGILPNCVHKSKSKLHNSKILLSLFDEDEGEENRYVNPEEEACHSTESSKNCYLKTAPENQLSHKLNFTSTYNFYDSSYRKEATTHHDAWITVDYMFFANMLLVARQRLPTVDDCVSLINRIPNNVSPSDHFPLLATYAL